MPVVRDNDNAKGKSWEFRGGESNSHPWPVCPDRTLAGGGGKESQGLIKAGLEKCRGTFLYRLY